MGGANVEWASLIAVNGSSDHYFCMFRFFEVTQKLRNLPIEITHEDVLIPEVHITTTNHTH